MFFFSLLESDMSNIFNIPRDPEHLQHHTGDFMLDNDLRLHPPGVQSGDQTISWFF